METGWRRNYLRYKSFFMNVMTHYKERSDWKAYLEILLSLATISIFSIFALRPTILTIAELITQIEEKKQTLATMNEKLENLGRAQTLYDRESASISLLISQAVPQTPNSDIFARQIEGLSSKHLIPVKSFSLGEAIILGGTDETTSKEESEEESPDTVKSDVYEFTLAAPINVTQYGSITSFIQDFENLRMTPVIEKLELGVDEESTANNKTLLLLIDGSLLYLNKK